MLRSPAARSLLVTACLTACVGWEQAEAQAGTSAPQGRALAIELGCGACHAGAPGPETVRSRAPALGPGGPPLAADFVFTYLGDPARRRQDLGATRMPDFRLDEGERVALALFLGTDPSAGAELPAARQRHPSAAAELGARIFDALGCAGCHAGVDGARPVAGPDLSREGARVLPGWLATYLAHPTPLRGPAHPTAPGARMPDFRLGDAEVSALVAWLQGQGRAFAALPDAPLTPVQTLKTERFLEKRGSCLGCHRIEGRGGRIGPSLEEVALRARPSFVLEMILDAERAAPGSPMPHQPMPPREAERLARYLLDRGGTAPHPSEARSLADPGHPAWVAAGGTGPAGPGAALYARHCAACHGPTGGGDGWNAPNLRVPPTRHADSALMSPRVDDALYDAVHAGGWVLDGSALMPGFGGLLGPGQIRALVAHVRTLCRCEAPAWSRDSRPGR